MNRYLMLLGGVMFCGVLYADPYWVEPDTRVEAIISLNQLNRIKVMDDRITQVFGDENTFSIDTDTETGQIFIKPKDEKRLFLTIVTENGESIDLALNPVEMHAQTLVLKTTPPQQTLSHRAEPLTSQIIHLITAMNEGNAIDGFTCLKASKEQNLGFLNLELQSLYQGDNLNGEIWVIKNTSHKIQYLTEKQFAEDASILAVAVKTLVLEPKSSTQLFKVKTHE